MTWQKEVVDVLARGVRAHLAEENLGMNVEAMHMTEPVDLGSEDKMIVPIE
jgi:hypothetical protein